MRASLTDVLIVGAGPAGLMCAVALARAGVPIRIIDKRAERVKVGHADGLMPRTMEVLQVSVVQLSLCLS
jgi:phenol 2-monooxygenase